MQNGINNSDMVPWNKGDDPIWASPTTWEEAAQRVASEITTLIAQKHLNYGTQGILGFGEAGIVVRVWDKINRLKTLVLDGKESDLPTARSIVNEFETVNDTWRDLAGYAIIALMLRQGRFTLPLAADKE